MCGGTIARVSHACVYEFIHKFSGERESERENFFFPGGIRCHTTTTPVKILKTVSLLSNLPVRMTIKLAFENFCCHRRCCVAASATRTDV